MSKQSGYLQRQAAEREDFSIKVQMTTRQFMIDTLQITLRNQLGWGYDRIMKLTEDWEHVRAEYAPAIDPRHVMCDVQQEHMDREFADICENKHIEVIPFKRRYPYIKEVRYDKPYK